MKNKISILILLFSALLNVDSHAHNNILANNDSLVIYCIYQPHTGHDYSDSNTSFLDSDKINILVAFIRNYCRDNDKKIILEYHTDIRGSSSANLKHSIFVLEKIKEELADLFLTEIEIGMIIFVPKGSEYPIYTKQIINKEKNSKKREEMHQKNTRLVIRCE